MTDLTPKEIMQQLDRHIVGQREAKKAVSLALRNRWRRQQLDTELQEEVTPKNILMIGPTGVGKTEIARRLAKIARAPFLKVEATKFTEVGYVGRDVEQIIRDLVGASLALTREEKRKEVEEKSRHAAEDRVLDALVGAEARGPTRETFREKLRKGKLDDREIDYEIPDQKSPFQSFDMPGGAGGVGMINMEDLLGGAFKGRTKKVKSTIREAYKPLVNAEADKLLDDDLLTQIAIDQAERGGMVFIDEIDKIAVRSDRRGGDVSREGVQRDLLPLLEGSTVSTKYGPVKTDHILFIASGAFHVAKPSDLLPELQGRLPIRVELHALTEADFVRILTEPEANLIEQYVALLATEEVTLEFGPEAIDRIAQLAAQVNANVENIGARRLHTIMEKLLEEISFEASERKGEKIELDADYVSEKVTKLAQNTDLSKFIL